jgi:hypothetical protein
MYKLTFLCGIKIEGASDVTGNFSLLSCAVQHTKSYVAHTHRPGIRCLWHRSAYPFLTAAGCDAKRFMFSLSTLNPTHRWTPLKAYWGSGGIAPLILDLGTRWRWVVSFTTWPLYPQGKSPWYPLDRRLGGPRNRSGRGGKAKKHLLLPGMEPRASNP